MNFATVLGTVSKHLAERRIPHAVVGTLALASYGLPRTTLDLDLVVDGEAQEDVDRREVRSYFERHALGDRFDELERTL